MSTVAFSNTGAQRHRVRVLLVLVLLVLLSFVLITAGHQQRLWLPFTGATLALVLIFGAMMWVEFKPPAAQWEVLLHSPCVLSCCQQQVRLYPITQLPGMVLLRTARRRFWVFADETSPTAWRQLLMHTRFTR